MIALAMTIQVNAESESAFMPDISITGNTHEEIYIEFTAEEAWPGEMTLNVFLGESSPFQEGESVFVYYINPVAKQNELIGNTVIKDNCAQITLDHSSLYLLTRTDYGQVYVPAAGGEKKRLFLFTAGVMIVIAVVLATYKKKRKLYDSIRTEEDIT